MCVLLPSGETQNYISAQKERSRLRDRSITVKSDHKPLQSIWKKSIISTSSRFQRLLLRLAHYDLNIEFVRGKENVIADALSRVCPLQSTHPKSIDSNIDVIPVHHIAWSMPISKTRLQELRLATQSDLTLTSLTKTVHEGWPQSKKDCPEQLLDFWSFRQEISEEDGLLYKSHRLIMMYSERLDTLKVLHLRHYAVDKMCLRALETYTGLELTKTYLDATRVVRLASSIQSLRGMGHCNLSYSRVAMAHSCNRLV